MALARRYGRALTSRGRSVRNAARALSCPVSSPLRIRSWSTLLRDPWGANDAVRLSARPGTPGLGRALQLITVAAVADLNDAVGGANPLCNASGRHSTGGSDSCSVASADAGRVGCHRPN